MLQAIKEIGSHLARETGLTNQVQFEMDDTLRVLSKPE